MYDHHAGLANVAIPYQLLAVDHIATDLDLRCVLNSTVYSPVENSYTTATDR